MSQSAFCTLHSALCHRLWPTGTAVLILTVLASSRWLCEYLSGFSVHRELHAFVLAGIPPAAALRFATINAARALGVGDRLGTIEAGKLADFVVIRGNPLADIRNTRNTWLVVKAGVVYDARELLRSVEGAIGPRTPEEIAAWAR